MEIESYDKNRAVSNFGLVHIWHRRNCPELVFLTTTLIVNANGQAVTASVKLVGVFSEYEYKAA